MARVAVLAATLSLGLAGCSRIDKENAVKTNVDELSKLVRLPAPPLRVQWQVVQPVAGSAIGPSDWQLAAVLEFKPEDRAKLLQDAVPAAIDTVFVPEFVLPWFPQPVKDLFKPRREGQISLEAAPLEATAFRRSPLSNGFFVPFGGGGCVLLYLYTS